MYIEKYLVICVVYVCLLFLKISYGIFMFIILRMCGLILILILVKYYYLCLKIVVDKN